MKSYGSFVAVAYAGVSVVVRQILYDELLADIDYLMHCLAGNIDQLYCELTRAYSQNL